MGKVFLLSENTDDTALSQAVFLWRSMPGASSDGQYNWTNKDIRNS